MRGLTSSLSLSPPVVAQLHHGHGGEDAAIPDGAAALPGGRPRGDEPLDPPLQRRGGYEKRWELRPAPSSSTTKSTSTSSSFISRSSSSSSSSQLQLSQQQVARARYLQLKEDIRFSPLAISMLHHSALCLLSSCCSPVTVVPACSLRVPRPARNVVSGVCSHTTEIGKHVFACGGYLASGTLLSQQLRWSYDGTCRPGTAQEVCSGVTIEMWRVCVCVCYLIRLSSCLTHPLC